MNSSGTSNSKRPGLFFVNSKITEPSLTPEIFTKWYNEVHVPDIIATSGIKSAFRYTALTAGTSERPYLACYPLKDVDFLEDQEFHSIPVSSDLLPKSGNSFDVASFDARPSILMKVFESKPLKTGPAPIIVILSFDISSKEADVHKTIVEGKLPFLEVKDSVRRTRLYKTHFTVKNSIPQKGNPVPKYFALVELEKEEMAEEFNQFEESIGAKVAGFKLLKAFGEVEEVY